MVDIVLHPGYGVNVALYDHYAYVAADNTGGLFVIDIEDPANLDLLDGGYGWNFYGITVAGEYAYAVDMNDFHVLDLADPANPLIIASCDGQATCRNLTVRDTLAYVVGSGLEIFNISVPAEPASIGFCDITGFARDIVVASHFAYVVADTAGMRVFDISNPTAPIEVGYYNTPGKAWGVTADGPIIYLADSSCFGVYEFLGYESITVGAPNGGERLHSLETVTITWSSSNVDDSVNIFINRDYPEGSWEMLFANLPDDGAEAWQVTGPHSDRCRIRIECVNDTGICDVSDADFSILRGQIELHPTVLDFGEVSLDSAAFASFWILNTDADTLHVDSVRSDHPAFMDLNDWEMDIMPGDSLIVGIGYVPPDTLTHTGHITVYSSAGDSSVLCTGRGVLVDATVSPAALPLEYALYPVFPNPFNATATVQFALPRLSQVAIKAFDVLGRETATITDGVREAGEHQVTWHCAGCASGVYVIVMSGSGFRFSQQVVMVK